MLSTSRLANSPVQLEEGLLALAVGAGLQVLGALMETEVTEIAGAKGRWNPDRVAVRHGGDSGEVTLGGRRVPISRPRVRTADRSEEIPLKSYELFSSTEVLGRLAMEKMLAKLSTRRYRSGLEPVGKAVEKVARSTSRSAVSRRFVAATTQALEEALSDGPVRARPRLSHGRRGPLRRPHLCRRARHRLARGEAPARPRGRRHRERHGGEGPPRLSPRALAST